MKPQDENRKLREYIRQSKQRRRWHRLTAVLATAAAVLTFCVMVLPAITLENTSQTLVCQLDDLHTHTDSCYNEEGELVCGYADFVAHTHDSSCYGEDGTLICPLEERKPHTHMESCYQETEVLVCGQEETQGHTHSEACYETQLVCGQEEGQGHTHTGHIHTEECYTVGETLVCTNTEPDHVHTEECYETQRELTCTQDTGCYDANGNLVCGLEETQGHTHTQACYETQLVCGQEESQAHTHTDSCYEVRQEVVCGQEEVILHTHTEECRDEEGNLTCGMVEVKEHVHDETCLPETASEPEDISQPEDSSAEESQTEESQTEESQTEESQTEESQTEESQTEEDQEVVSQSGTSWATVSKPGYEPAEENGVALFSAKALLAEPLAETSYDFAENIVSVTVEKQEGSQWTQSDRFTDGDTIRVTIRYEIPADVITADQTTMHYQLPGGIALEKEETGSVYLEDGTQAGTYTIRENGLITIVFEQKFANGEAFSGSLQFQGSIALADAGEGQKIEFGGTGGTITVVPEEKNYSLNIGKVGAYVRDPEDFAGNNLEIVVEEGHVLYTLEVWANEGSDGSDGTITITDQFMHDPGDGVVQYDRGNLAIYKRSPTVGGSMSNPVKIEQGTYKLEYTHQQETTDDTQTSSFTITGLPALTAGEVYIITYSADPYLDTVHSPTGYIEIPNTATATDKSQDVSAEANVLVSGNMVYKTVTENAGTGNVQWTVNINEDCRDISGMTFTDTMTYTVDGQQQTYDPKEIVNLQVTAYSGGTRQGDVTGLFTGLLSYDNGVLSVTFPQNNWPEGLDPTWTYYITYETPYPDGVEIGEGIYFHNTATLGDYTATADWNGNVPEQGYGLVKQSTGDNLNTGTDVGTVNWQATISYPADLSVPDAYKEYAKTGLDMISYKDWIANVYYEDSGQFIDGSHYTTLTTLKDSLWITNAQGTRLLWGKDFTVNVVYADAVTSGTTFNKGDASTLLGDVFEKNKKEIQDPEDGNEPIALFSIEFTSLDKLTGGRQLYISYQTLVDRQGTEDGRTVNIDNVGAILSKTAHTGLETAFHPQLQKQVSTTGMAPSGDDFNLDSETYVDGPVNIDLGDTGGRLYYRILFYNYTDAIQFHDDMLEKFDNYWAFDQQMRIYNVTTGETRTVKTWDYLDSSGRNFGNYTLKNLGQFKDCIIGLYYSIDVSQDPAWENGDTLTYTNTVEWTGIGEDSTTANVTNSEQTLKKVGVQTDENGETLVTYYVVINPEGRDLHPESDTLELRDTLSLPNGVTADLRLETIGLYHYDPLQDNNLGPEVTEEEFVGFQVKLEEGTANTYTFTVPDEMACVVMYTYQINLGTSALEEIPVSNTASLLGRAVIGAGDEVVIQAQDSSAQVNKATLTIYKYGGDNRANLLQGVLFDLDRYEQKEDGTYGWVRTAITAKGEEDKNGKHFVTGGDGVEGAIILNFLDEGNGGGSHYNTLYRLTEYKTLDGYELDTTPHYYVWGEANATEEQTAAAMAEVLAETDVNWDQVTFIPFGESKTDYIQNLPTTTEITVTKTWQGAEGTPLEEDLPDSVEVTLYQQTAEGEPVQYGDPVTLTADTNWTYTWEQLPKEVDGQAVTYTVVETTITGWEASYDYGEGATGTMEGTVIITNTKQSAFTLPETGGVGPTLVAIAGVPLVGAAGVVYWNLRRKRRRGGKGP